MDMFQDKFTDAEIEMVDAKELHYNDPGIFDDFQENTPTDEDLEDMEIAGFVELMHLNPSIFEAIKLEIITCAHNIIDNFNRHINFYLLKLLIQLIHGYIK